MVIVRRERRLGFAAPRIRGHALGHRTSPWVPFLMMVPRTDRQGDPRRPHGAPFLFEDQDAWGRVRKPYTGSKPFLITWVLSETLTMGD